MFNTCMCCLSTVALNWGDFGPGNSNKVWRHLACHKLGVSVRKQGPGVPLSILEGTAETPHTHKKGYVAQNVDGTAVDKFYLS